jgi:hypothetical protein
VDKQIQPGGNPARKGSEPFPWIPSGVQVSWSENPPSNTNNLTPQTFQSTDQSWMANPLSQSKCRFQFSPFSALLRDGFDRMQEFIDTDRFTFVVNGQSFVVPLTDALLLSSRVCESLRNDCSCRSFRIETNEASSADFEGFLTFSRSGRCGTLELQSGLAFLSFCRFLGNDNLALVLLGLLHPIVSLGSVGEGLEAKLRRISVCDADVDFCASRFYFYSADEVRRLDHSLLHRILGSPSLALRSEDAFLGLISDLGDDFSVLLNYVEVCHLSKNGISDFVDRIGFEKLSGVLWAKVGNRLKGVTPKDGSWQRFSDGIPSVILENYPSLFDRFGCMRWQLLYRGSIDGFRASNFHGKCDGKSNTVTLIMTTTGCIFGGFSPIAWDSNSGHKADWQRQSFLFRIKDSRDSPPSIFPISNPSYGIFCDQSFGPVFGNGGEIEVRDNCSQNANSHTNLGGNRSYTNDTGLSGDQVFTGEYNFTVNDIEVFTFTE